MTQASKDFEFEALTVAENYRASIVEIFRPYLAGEILELGAGIGQMSALFSRLPAINSFLAVEPSDDYSEKFRERLPEVAIHHGVLGSLPSRDPYDAIVSINVFEHIEDDNAEFALCQRRLKPGSGYLCLLVPACPELYAPIDRDFGHFRRYTPAELRRKLEAAGFTLKTLRYFNVVGYFAWWFNFRLIRSRTFSVNKLRFFDRVIFPTAQRIERLVANPPLGQSLIAVARA